MINYYMPYRHYGCRVNDQITWGGYKALLLQNELIQIVVLVDKGSEIVQFLYKPLDIDFLWHSENTLHHPSKFIPTGNGSSTDFLDHWTGSWFEVLPNGGPACVYQGAEFGQFAETINVPWNYRIDLDTSNEVRISLWIDTYRSPFRLTKSLTIKSNIPALFIDEEVTNTGAQPADFMWGHHPVIGPPFLDDTCKLWAPPSVVEIIHAEDGPDHRMGLFQECDWPFIKDRNGDILDLRIIPGPESKSMDNCYLKDFTEGWIAVTKSDIGFGLAWDPKIFRYVWIWQAFGGGIGYPWYGRTYNMGIEPWTSYPCMGLAEAVNRGTAMQLPPGKTLRSWLTAVAIQGSSEVNQILRSGQVI